MSEEQVGIEAEQAGEGRKSTGELSLRTRFLLDLGPLLAFFGSYYFSDIFWATGAFMGATIIAIAIYWQVERKIPVIQWISAIIVVGFGALTLLLDDPRFIKMKPTLIYGMFAAILFYG
ncbi:MAG: septation protein IspZ, partial [Alphaproteobacteria bacterium]|nr:septation protein IspZ [Alphaproteobacteria bacterium]